MRKNSVSVRHRTMQLLKVMLKTATVNWKLGRGLPQVQSRVRLSAWHAHNPYVSTDQQSHRWRVKGAKLWLHAREPGVLKEKWNDVSAVVISTVHWKKKGGKGPGSKELKGRGKRSDVRWHVVVGMEWLISCLPSRPDLDSSHPLTGGETDSAEIKESQSPQMFCRSRYRRLLFFSVQGKYLPVKTGICRSNGTSVLLFSF